MTACLLGVGSLLLLAAQSASAEDANSASIQVGQHLNMVVTEDFPPFYFRHDGRYQGASFEIVSELLSRLGYLPEITSVPMKRLLRGLEYGWYDLAPNLSETPSRRRAAVFTQVPFLYESHNLMVLRGSDIEFDGNLRSMSRYRFGAIAGWTHGPNFDAADYLQKEYRNNVNQQIRSLLAGRFDVAVNNREYFLYHARGMNVLDQVRVLSPATYLLPVTIGISRRMRGAEQLAIDLDRELVKFQQEPAYQQILEHYGFRRPNWDAPEPARVKPQ